MIYSINFKSNKISRECFTARDICLLRADHFIAVKTAGWPEHEITKQKEICSGKYSEVHKTNELSTEGYPPAIK